MAHRNNAAHAFRPTHLLTLLLSGVLVFSGTPAEALAEMAEGRSEAEEVTLTDADALADEDIFAADVVEDDETDAAFAEELPTAADEAFPEGGAEVAEAVAEPADDEELAPTQDEPLAAGEAAVDEAAADEEPAAEDVDGAAVDEAAADEEPAAEDADEAPARASSPASEADLEEHSGYARLIQYGDLPLHEDGPAKAASDIPAARRVEIKDDIATALNSCKKRLAFYNYDIDITSDQLMELFSEVVNENPDFWYVSNYLKWQTFEDYVFTCTFTYTATGSQLESMKAKYSAAMADLLSYIPRQATTVQKLKAAHDWLVLHNDYNQAYADKNITTAPADPESNPFSAYGALVYGHPVCQGYTLAYMAVLKQQIFANAGVQCKTAETSTHIWNCVYVDSYWYHVDVTFDDPVGSANKAPTVNTYFLKSDSKLKALAKNEKNRTHASWSPSSPACLSTLYDGTSNWQTYAKSQDPNAVKSFNLSSSKLTLDVEGTATLTKQNVTPTNATVTNAVWTSSDSSIAWVNNEGKVTATSKPGTVTITCRLGNATRTCKVTVVESIKRFNIELPKMRYGYTGSAIKPVPTVVHRSSNGTAIKTLKAGTDYTVSYSNNTRIGTATVTVKGKGGYRASHSTTFKIVQGSATASAKKKTVTVSLAKVSKKARKVKNLSVPSGQGKVTYKLVTNKKTKKFKVGKSNGKLTIPKGTAKGTYKIKIKVTTKGSTNFKAGTKTVSFKVKVK